MKQAEAWVCVERWNCSDALRARASGEAVSPAMSWTSPRLVKEDSERRRGRNIVTGWREKVAGKQPESGEGERWREDQELIGMLSVEWISKRSSAMRK